MDRWDGALFQWINRWPDGLNPLFQFFSEGNKWLWVRIVLVGILAAMAIWGKKGGRKAALLALLAAPIANEVTDVLKASFPEPRPCSFDETICRVKVLTSMGTASAHAANMAAVAAVMTWFTGRWGWIWIGIALLTGLSRIYVGVHFPQQVLFGWLVGILSAALVVSVYEWIVRSRRPEPDEAEESPEIA